MWEGCRGSVGGLEQLLNRISAMGTGLSCEAKQPYMPCSSELTEGFCAHVDLNLVLAQITWSLATSLRFDGLFDCLKRTASSRASFPSTLVAPIIYYTGKQQ